MGIPKEIRDRTLNHITPLRDPESKHYNLYEFQSEKRQTLSKWANQIAAIIEPAAIVPTQRRNHRQTMKELKLMHNFRGCLITTLAQIHA